MRFLEQRMINVDEVKDSIYQERTRIETESFMNDIIRRGISPENIPPIEIRTTNEGLKEIIDGHRRVAVFKEILRRSGDNRFKQILAKELIDYIEYDIYERHYDTNKSQPLNEHEKERRIILAIRNKLFLNNREFVKYLKEREGIEISEAYISQLHKSYNYREFCLRVQKEYKLKKLDVIENMSTSNFYFSIYLFPSSKAMKQINDIEHERKLFINTMNNLEEGLTQKEIITYNKIIGAIDDVNLRVLISSKFNFNTIIMFNEIKDTDGKKIDIIDIMLKDKEYNDKVRKIIEKYDGNPIYNWKVKKDIENIFTTNMVLEELNEDGIYKYIRKNGEECSIDWQNDRDANLKVACAKLIGGNLGGLTQLINELNKRKTTLNNLLNNAGLNSSPNNEANLIDLLERAKQKIDDTYLSVKTNKKVLFGEDDRIVIYEE